MKISKERKKVLSKGRTKIDIINKGNDKIVYITLIGMFTQESAETFFEQYMNMLKHIYDTKKYDLIIDCMYLGLISKNQRSGVGEAYKCYDKFKSVTFLCPSPATSTGSIQLKAIAREGNHERFLFI